ncbi:MAG: hypothetical protein HOP19_15400 [Acidobacteria bacterium]|nr:hypothetical protein [Acidobacteriota bacterium]
MTIQSDLRLRRVVLSLLTAFLVLPLVAAVSFAGSKNQAGSAEEAYFLLEEYGTRKDLFVIRLTDAALIQRAREIIIKPDPFGEIVPFGKLVKTAACYNPGWNYQLNVTRFVGATAEALDTTFRYAEDHLSETLGINDMVDVGSLVIKELPKPDCTGNYAFHVSAASYKRSNLTREGLIAAFGSNMTARTEIAATLPLPTALGGVTVTIKDSAGMSRLAQLLFVSPNQINYLMPLGVALGNATITINDGQGRQTKAYEFIRQAGPALFSANGNGRGVAAGSLLRVRSNGTQVWESLFTYDATKREYVPRTVGFERADEEYYLVLFGSGIRGRQVPLSEVVASGAHPATVLYAGSQLQIAGLDQVNIRLPKELAGQGLINLRLLFNDPEHYRESNTVEVRLGGVRTSN